MAEGELSPSRLSKFGYSADLANNGKEALKALVKINYDIVFMDIQMPEMDGFTATEIIRDLSSSVLNHNVPIVAMTANPMTGDKEKCLEAGMTDYISKPINPKFLLDMIQHYLNEPNNI